MVEGALFTFLYYETVNHSNGFEFKTDVGIFLQTVDLPDLPDVWLGHQFIKFLSLSKMNVVTWSYTRMYNITVLENI
jgi:hypothetical protein